MPFSYHSWQSGLCDVNEQSHLLLFVHLFAMSIQVISETNQVNTFQLGLLMAQKCLFSDLGFYSHFPTQVKSLIWFYAERIMLPNFLTQKGNIIFIWGWAEQFISAVDDFIEQWDRSTATLMEELYGLQRRLLKNISHLVTFHESILVSLWIFSCPLYAVKIWNTNIYLPTLPLGQDMIQGQFLSRV